MPDIKPGPDRPNSELMLTIPQNSFFRFRIPCRHTTSLWSKEGVALDESFRLPFLASLNEDSNATNKPSQRPSYDFRIGWNEKGFVISLDVFGKSQRPWCRTVHPDESDGLQLCLDTRNIKDVHRATRFCHRLVFLPTQGTSGKIQPCVVWLPIHRAKDHPNPINLNSIRLTSQIKATGYRLDIFLPAETLTGYDPNENPEIGFHFILADKELGNQYFLLQPPLPIDQDPSLWGTLELVS